MAKKHFPFFEIEISKNFPSGISTHIDWKPLTNISECQNSLIIEMELPGVDKKDVSITLLNDQELVIKGIKRQPGVDDKRLTYYLFEREYGNFYKRILIDFPLDTSNITSDMDNGVLTIAIKKRATETIHVEIK